MSADEEKKASERKDWEREKKTCDESAQQLQKFRYA